MTPTDTTTTSVDRALNILECVAKEGTSGLSNSEISRRLEIPKSSASYLLRTLEKRGYLRRGEEDGKYRLGLKVLGLGHRALSEMDLRRIALPILMRLVERTRVTAHLAILDHRRVVYIEKAEPHAFIKMNTWVGRDLPLHSTSVGKALLAHLPSERLREILGEGPLERQTPKTLTTVRRLLDDLERIRTRGWAVDDEENNLGVRCLAVPVFGPQRQVTASLGVSGTTSQITWEAVPHMVEQLQRAANAISRSVGSPPH